MMKIDENMFLAENMHLIYSLGWAIFFDLAILRLLDSHCHGWDNQSGFTGDNAFGISINYDKTIVNIASA